MTTVQILDYPSGVTNGMLHNGKLYLDIDPDEVALRLTRVLEQLSTFNKLTQEAALSFPVLRTDKNNMLLERFRINALEDAQPIRVQVVNAGHRFNFDKLQVVEYDNQEYEIELFGGGWLDDLKELQLRTLDLGTFLFTKANVQTTWADPKALVYPAPAFYGKWNVAGQLSLIDLRFDFNIYKLLKIAFASIGWTYVNTYLESNQGQSLYAYISGEKWHSYTGKNDIARVDVAATNPITLTGIFELVTFDEISDPFNLYNNTSLPNGVGFSNYRYAINGQDPTYLDIFINDLQITLPPVAEAGTFVYGIMKNSSFEDFLWVGSKKNSTTQPVTLVINETITDAECKPLDTYGFFVIHTYNGQSYPLTIDSGEIIFSPDTSKYIDGDSVPVADTIDPELTGADLLGAITHWFAGKFQTDHFNKTVTQFPPANVDDIEGFFQDHQAPIIITDKVLSDSGNIKKLESKRAKVVELNFKTASDAHIKDLDGPANPYGYTHEFDQGTLKPEKLTNKLIEPTLERLITAADIGASSNVFIPARTDNLDGKLSTDIGVRFGFCYGLTERRPQPGDPPISINFEGDTITQWGLISQLPQGNINHPAQRLTYEESYRRFYQYDFTTRFPKAEADFLAWIDINEYHSYNFRRPFGIHYEGAYLLYRLLQIRDFTVARQTPTPVTLIPLR